MSKRSVQKSDNIVTAHIISWLYMECEKKTLELKYEYYFDRCQMNFTFQGLRNSN